MSIEQANSYIVRVSLAEDINAPYVWLSSLPCKSREIVKLTNAANRKSVWCEVVLASDNYIDRYTNNDRTIGISHELPFMAANEWYREILGISKNEHANIKITISWWPLFIRQLLASYKHPDNTIRLAADLAIVSVILGGVGLILGIISLCR